jgi:DNA repair exonuclease SbcCD ATPase subunit
MEQRRSTVQLELRNCEQIRARNVQAEQINTQIAELELIKRSLEAQYPKLPEMLQSEIDISAELSMLQQSKQNFIKQQTIQKEIAGLPQNPDQLPTTDLIQETQRIWGEIAYLRNRAQALKDGKCPTCGAEHDAGSIQADIENLVQLQAQYDSAMQDMELIRVKNNGILRRKELEKHLGIPETFTEQEDNLLNTLQEYQMPMRKYQDTVTRLSGMQHHPVEDEKPTDEMLRQIAECDEIIKQLRSCVQAKAEIAKLVVPKAQSLDAIDNALLHMTEAEDESAQEEAGLRTKHGELKGQNDRFHRLQTQLETLNKRLGTLPELRQLEVYWEAMVDAYGPKGLRVKQLQKIMDMVVVRLPYYTQFLFREKGLSFSHTCDYGNIYINAHRSCLVEKENEEGIMQTVSQEIIHDIATFSGGECKRLSVALVLTLADCVVRTKKSNMLILDEVDSNLDSLGQYLYVNELLPFLREKYVSVFIISHDKEIKQAAVYDRVWLLEKENHWTTLTIQGAA